MWGCSGETRLSAWADSGVWWRRTRGWAETASRAGGGWAGRQAPELQTSLHSHTLPRLPEPATSLETRSASPQRLQSLLPFCADEVEVRGRRGRAGGAEQGPRVRRPACILSSLQTHTEPGAVRSAVASPPPPPGCAPRGRLRRLQARMLLRCNTPRDRLCFPESARQSCPCQDGVAAGVAGPGDTCAQHQVRRVTGRRLSSHTIHRCLWL